MSGWWKSLPNGLPNVVSPPKSGHRRAAKGMEFPWRCNVDTIAMDLKVSWEMSAVILSLGMIGNQIPVTKPLPDHALRQHRHLVDRIQVADVVAARELPDVAA